MKILGIDFGAGETAASSALLTTSGKWTIKCVNIRVSEYSQARKIPSVIMRQPDGSYSISAERGQLILSFKGRVVLPEDKINDETQLARQRAFHAFIRDVYNLIRNNNKSFFDGDDDVVLYVAAPTRWSEEDKRNYKKFVEDATKCNVGWIINESDAAFFCKSDLEATSGTTLIVDYGSSTIDFTLMKNGHKVNIDNLSTDFGAGEIEDIVLLDYKNSNEVSSYKEMYSQAKESLKNSGKRDIDDITSFLKLSIRKSKEEFYTDYPTNPDYKKQYFRFTWRLSEATGIEADKAIKFEYSFKEQKLAPYKDKVKDAFSTVYGRISELKDIGQPECIILTGGASIMPWVEGTVKSVWGDTVRIISDSHPDYVVANGIVSYAKAEFECKEEVQKIFDEWMQTSRENVKKILYEQINIHVKEIIGNRLKPVLDNYLKAKDNATSYRHLANSILTFVTSACDDKVIHADIEKKVLEYLNDNIGAVLSAVMTEHFKKKDIKCTMDIKTLSIRVNGNGLANFIKRKFGHCLDQIDNRRDVSERQNIVNAITEHLNKNRSFPIVGDVSSEEVFENIVSEIKESLDKWVENSRPFMVW